MSRREYNDTGVCAICNKVIQEDEGRYGMTGNHYDCEKPVTTAELRQMADNLGKNVEAALTKLRSVTPVTDRPVKRR